MAAIPCYNEDRFIGSVVLRTKKYVDQVIVVDDGSHDSTAEAAMTVGALVVSHGVNNGYGESIKSCFGAGKAHGADIMVTLDGDEQHRPEEIPVLLAPILKGEADLVIGSRFLEGKRDMPRYRKLGIGVITWLCNVGSKVKVSDSQSGFRAYSRRVLDAVSLNEKGMAISVEVLIKTRGQGFVIQEVPISCSYHSKSSTLNPVSHGLGVALTVVKLRFRNLLLRLMGVISA
jgi:glycosyltransferase involved in cell wall biosynthesis